MFDVAYRTDKGAVLDSSDDRIFVNGAVIASGEGTFMLEEDGLFAVCDGVGGEAHGDEAAMLAASELSNFLKLGLDQENINLYIEAANDKVIEAQRRPGHAHMATTVAGLYVCGDDYWVFNVGDSRVYRYRYPYISLLTTDHTLVREFTDWGMSINPEQEHVITRYIGGNRAIPSIVDGRDAMGTNDVFLLCSDGAWNVVDDITMEKILASNTSASEMCNAIYKTALDNQSDDNISVVVVRRV